MESIKNGKRKSNRFVMCFKPVDMEDGGSVVKTVTKNGGTTTTVDHVLASNTDSVGNNKDFMIPVLSSVLSDEGVKVLEEVVIGKGKKLKFSRILKVALFETSLDKKTRNKKSRKYSLGSSSNLSTNSENSSNSIQEKTSSDEDNNNRRTNSNISSTRNSTITSAITATLGPSIASSSRSISGRMGSFRSNSMEELKQREDGWNHGLCLLLVSLLMLILWGKVCAIFCTSTWFFFFPRRDIRHGSPGIGVGFPGIDSVENKKMVIMEGLLGTNRSRVPGPVHI